MDLGLQGKRGIVCASTKGLGRACALALAGEGVEVLINGRSQENVDKTVAEVKARGGKAIGVAADMSTKEGRAAVLAAMPEPDILVTNNGGPPHGDFREWDEEDWHKALEGNMIAPIMMIKAVVDGMAERKFGRIVNITSRSVRTPIFDLGLSNGARAGLTGFVAGLCRQVAKDNVIINNLLPAGVMTERVETSTRIKAEKLGISEEEVLRERTKGIPTRKLGNAEEFGRACAFLCNARIGNIVGQNILFDGGSTMITV